jgi:hypothetical protein
MNVCQDRIIGIHVGDLVELLERCVAGVGGVLVPNAQV